MPRKKPFSVKQKKKQLQDKRERKRGQRGARRGGRGLPRPGGGCARRTSGARGGRRPRVGACGADAVASAPPHDGGWRGGREPPSCWGGRGPPRGRRRAAPAPRPSARARAGRRDDREAPRVTAPPAGLQDGLRSSSNSRSGSRERREEQTDTSDGESVTQQIRRLNQQPPQGLGPRGFDPNR